MLPRGAAKAFVRRLLNPETVSRASRTIADHGRDLRKAILPHIERLQGLSPLSPQVCAEANEIRGLADAAGLNATGRIADRLCSYLEGITRTGVAADPIVVRLHLDAIVRASNAADEAKLLGDAVVQELDTLVARRLSASPKR